MISAGTSGGCGDIVYSIPVMKKLGVTRVFVKENWYKHPFHSVYSTMKDLLQMQGFEVMPTAAGYHPMQYEPGLNLDFDMDKFRMQRERGRVHIMINMFRTFGLTNNGWQQPWLKVNGTTVHPLPEKYSLIQLTSRWRENSLVNWERIYMRIDGPVYFIGFEDEHQEFCRRYGQIEYLECENVLAMARLIRDCHALYCNQSIGLTLAQGQGKNYFLELKPGKSNTRMYTKNENILS